MDFFLIPCYAKRMKREFVYLLCIIMLLLSGCHEAAPAKPPTTDEQETVVTLVDPAEEELADSIQTILSDKDYYPHIQSIDSNDSHTEFVITLESAEMNMYESMLVMSFYTFGDTYQLEHGIPAHEVKTVVRYINGATGDTIIESDSTSMNVK